MTLADPRVPERPLSEAGERSAPEPGWGEVDGRILEGMDDYWVAVFWSLLPTVVVSGLFFFILRSILRADRTERRVYARIEAEERAKRGLPPEPATSER
ncbi:hypothetical protein GCM10009807_05390 [Microbacterium lacus]|uniref:Uncharacterized protein n=2 Tax=Microbacteriaceae TaxID=85023 RepID=A0ABP4S0B3_9MICO